MKRNVMRAMLTLLSLLTVLSLAACQSAKTPDIKDFDVSKQYEMPDYSTLKWKNYVQLGDYRAVTLKLDAKELTVTDSEVESAITEQLKQHPSSHVTDRPVAWGDTVVVDYVGKKDGVAFQGGTASNQVIEITTPNGYIPGFIEGLVGVLPGVPTDAPMTFPTDYHATDLAGKEVVFTFTVSYIEAIPELTDALAAELSEGECATAEEYRATVRAQMEKEAYDEAVVAELWAQIIEGATIKKYPEDAVMYYYSNMYRTYAYYAYSYGLDYEAYLSYMGATPDMLFESCVYKVEEDMVIRTLIAAERYTYTQEEFDLALDDYTVEMYQSLNDALASNGSAPLTLEQARDYFLTNYRGEVELELLMQKAAEDLLSTATIER